MLPTGLQTKNPDERRLNKLFRTLSKEDKQTLLRFAEFLNVQEKTEVEEEEQGVPEPKIIPRPAEESVIKAVRRLSKTYFMVEKGKMLNKTSSLMAEHVMQGRSAKDVIDDLEAEFRKQYDMLVEEAANIAEAKATNADSAD